MPEQRCAVKHRPLIVDTADLGSQCQLPLESIAQEIAMVGREFFEACPPCGVIDGAPDRLHIKSVARHLLNFSTKCLQPGEARSERRGNIGRNRTPGGREAKQDLASAQIAAWRCPGDKI